MSTSFENSAMKSSFSLSSLRTGSVNGPLSGKQEPSLERPYHSLTKKRKEPCREAWRRSWGSGGSVNDDLWPLLQSHYDYIMDNAIIDTCNEANGELSMHNTTALSMTSLNRQWSLKQLISEFDELCQWMSSVQEEIYSSPENLSNRNLRMSRMSDLVAAEPRRVKFVEQAAAILERIPEARDEVSWRVEHLNQKWECVRLLLSPEAKPRDGENGNTVDTMHEIRCLRRWLHCMEGRLPPPSLSAARAAPPHDLRATLSHHQVCRHRCERFASVYNSPMRTVRLKVLQRDVECHGRVVSWVVRLSEGSAAARALERRWHLLYLRAIEWQCHLEACIATSEAQQGRLSPEALSDSDDEPALKQPRLARRGSPRRSPRRSPRTTAPPCRALRPPDQLPDDYRTSGDSDESYSEEEQDDFLLVYRCSDTDAELACLTDGEDDMDGARRVPSRPGDTLCAGTNGHGCEDCLDGVVPNVLNDDSQNMSDRPPTPPTVVKRKKPKDSSKFNQSNRKSKNCATFYFRHHDTDSDRQRIEDEKSQEETSEEEWTYIASETATSHETTVMTSSVEVQCELPVDQGDQLVEKVEKMESTTPDLLKVEHSRCKDIERLVMQAEVLVQKKAQQQMVKVLSKSTRSMKPMVFEEEGKSSRAKMSRIKEWLKNSTEGSVEPMQCGESYDASGEYTTESEVEQTSLASEDRNLHSSMDMSTSTCTVTPTHHNKVTLRKKRAGGVGGAGGAGGTRPWSVSCVSQLALARAQLATAPPLAAATSISEGALHTLAGGELAAELAAELGAGSVNAATVQGHVSSSNTIEEACVSCQDVSELKRCSLRRKRLKLRRRHLHNTDVLGCGADELGRRGARRGDRLVKSRSFSGRLSPAPGPLGAGAGADDRERSAASDPATSRKHRFDAASTSASGSLDDSDSEQLRQQLATIASLRRSIERTHISPEQPDVAPAFKLGPVAGAVRPRVARSGEREGGALLGLHVQLGDPRKLWELCLDSDERSATHTTTHSSFSEQAWDFYQEKYNSEPYSEAPDSDAARRLLEFGDDYRAFLDSQSDCCSSLSAHPDHDNSPSNTRRRRPPSEMSRERSLPKHKKPTRLSPDNTRKPKKSMSSAERKKSLLDSLERSRNSASLESSEGVRRRNSRNKSSLSEVDLLSRRRLNSSDEVNSSLEYNDANRPDILDSLRRKDEEFLSKMRRRSIESEDSDDSSPKKHRKGKNDGGSNSDSDEISSLIRRSTLQLEATEVLLASQDASPDILQSPDYSEVVARCRDNIGWLEAAVARTHGRPLSAAHCRDIRAVSARWSALRAAAARRGSARRLRRELAALRGELAELSEPHDAPPQLHTKAHLNRRIDTLKERLAKLLEVKVSLLKVTVSVRRALCDLETEDAGAGLSADLATTLRAWDDAHSRTSSELVSLEKASAAWSEWEAGLRALQADLRGDSAALARLRDGADAEGAGTGAAMTEQIRELAAQLVDRKKCGSSSGSLSDSGISDGDSDGSGSRARRLHQLRALAQRLQHALSPSSHAYKHISKRMEQTECEVRELQESCRALVEKSIPELKSEIISKEAAPASEGAGDCSRGHWLYRALRSSLPIQLCLVALLLAAWLADRPRCCDSLNSLAHSLTPQLRYVRGPPPV